MTSQTYINLTDNFIEGLRDYLKINRIPLDEVVEVFAGNGKLGLQLGLKEGCNISDSLLFASNGYEDEVNAHWERKPHGVAVESAYETVIRFMTEKEQYISLLIIGAPPPANSFYCPSYEAMKALHFCFNTSVLYIGEMNSFAFASPKFFKHLKVVEDDLARSFQNLVKNNYDNQNGYFASKAFGQLVDVQPYLLSFIPCEDENCDCRDDSKIQEDIHSMSASKLNNKK